MEYLEEKYPEKRRLLPQNPECRGVRGLTLLVVAGIQPLQNPRVSEHFSQGDKAKKLDWTHHWIGNGFTALEAELKNCSGKYAFGDNPTMLDVVITPQVYNASVKFGMDISKYPTIKAVDERFNQLEIIKKSRPENQPDYVKK
ncbi:hypothetical protein L596_020343 [Steinernema carpocapsae]|uniref:GST C-terminal domain-containing protein n=1 Tax=Steinernema carpocapsae TaxID=34508 RepID=A0A4V6XW00_STECR|nr:hypothetical protein L596_020343 [Steinernema carpocapsae]